MPDFSGTVVTALNQVVQVNSSVPGSYDSVGRLGLQLFDVREYGALGDGSNDDTAEIQAAIDAARGVNGVVYFRKTANYYKISSALTCPDEVHLFGVGYPEIRQVTANTKGIYVTGSNVSVRGLRVRGDGSASGSATANGIAIHAVGTSAASPLTNVVIDDVDILNWSRSGIELEWVNDFQVIRPTITNIKTHGILTLSCKRGTLDVPVVDTVGSTTDTYGITLTRRDNDSLVAYPHSQDITLTSPRVRTVAFWEGIDTHGGQRITLTAPQVYGCKIGIAVVDARNTAGTATFASQDIQILNPVIDSGLTTGAAGAGIVFAGVSAAVQATGIIDCPIVRGHGDSTSASSGGVVCTHARVDIRTAQLTECSPHGVVLFTNTIGSTVQGAVVTDAWSNSVTSCAAVQVSDASGTARVWGVTLLRGTKSATTVNARGVSTTGSGITISAWGNELTAAATDYADGSVTTKRAFRPRGRIVANYGVSAAVGPDRGDTSQTLTAGVDDPVQRWDSVLTQNRTITLATPSDITEGDWFRVVRSGLGSFTLDVGGLKTLPSATAAWAEVTYTGSAWKLTAYGTL